MSIRELFEDAGAAGLGQTSDAVGAGPRTQLATEAVGRVLIAGDSRTEVIHTTTWPSWRALRRDDQALSLLERSADVVPAHTRLLLRQHHLGDDLASEPERLVWSMAHRPSSAGGAQELIEQSICMVPALRRLGCADISHWEVVCGGPWTGLQFRELGFASRRAFLGFMAASEVDVELAPLHRGDGHHAAECWAPSATLRTETILSCG